MLSQLVFDTTDRKIDRKISRFQAGFSFLFLDAKSLIFRQFQKFYKNIPLIFIFIFIYFMPKIPQVIIPEIISKIQLKI